MKSWETEKIESLHVYSWKANTLNENLSCAVLPLLKRFVLLFKQMNQ